jgi:hypothetical protein
MTKKERKPKKKLKKKQFWLRIKASKKG